MGKGSKAPAGYQPTGQAQADQNYQNLVAGATPYANALPATVIPGLTQVSQNVQNDPYFADAMYGAQYGNAAAQQQVVPGQLNANANLNALGNIASVYAPQATAGAGLAQGNYDALTGIAQQGLQIGQTGLAGGINTYNGAQSLIPSTTQGSSLAPGISMDGLIKAQQQYQQAQAAIPGLTGGMDAANQVLQTGFDPQHQLYDRTAQQVGDRANALNAMYGLNTSAAGAGLANDASRNFNIDWQNAQLGRQVQALGAYGTEQGQVARNLTDLMNTGTNNYNSLTNSAVGNYNALNAGTANNFATLANSGTAALSAGTTAANQSIDNYRQALTQAAQNYQTLMGGAVDNYGNLVNAANAAYGGAGTQGTNAIQLAAAAGAAPNQTYLQQQQAQIAALQALSQSGGQSLAPTQQLIDANGNYLQIGQGATRNAQQAAQINNAQAAGIGKLVGTVASFALAPATGGLSLFSLGSAFTGGGAAGGFMSGVGNLMHNDPTGMWSLGTPGGP
jgi:hypothetical protein